MVEFCWLTFFQGFGVFLFVLVPISISWKITVRTDIVNGRRGLQILRKFIMWRFATSVGLTKTAPHLWSGKCYLVWLLVFCSPWKMKISSIWLTHREGMERSFFKKQNIRKKHKSWFLSQAVWLLHNLELTCTESLLYTQLNKLSPPSHWSGFTFLPTGC